MRWMGFRRSTQPDNLRRTALDPTGGRQCLVPLRGVVFAVYPAKTPSGSPNVAAGAPNVPDPIGGVVCDVEIIEPGWRGPLYSVPVLKQSGGLADHVHFRPQAMGKAINGGPLKLEGGADATPRDQADGDYVVVQFLGGDLARPVIMGQLAHPNTTVPYHSYTGYRFVRWLAGVRFGVANDGAVDIDMTAATPSVKATITVSDATTIVIADGQVTVEGAKLTVNNSAVLPVQFVLLEALLTDLSTLLAEWFPALVVVGAIFGITFPQSPAILAGLASGTGPGGAYKATDTEST